MRLALLLATLFCFVWQGILLPSHMHPAARAFAAATGQVQVQADRKQGPSDSPADCPICREVAHFAPYLPSGPLAFALATLVFAWLYAAPMPIRAIRSRSHIWTSRGPPTP